MSTAAAPVMTTAVTGSNVSGLADASTGTDTQVRRSEKLLLYSVCFFRFAGLAQIGVVLTTAAAGHHTVVPAAMLASCITAESLLLVWVCLRQGRLASVWITTDLVFCAAVLILNAWLSRHLPDAGWSRWTMRDFTLLVSSVAIGLTYRQLSAVLAMTTVVATAWQLPDLLIHDLSYDTTNLSGTYWVALLQAVPIKLLQNLAAPMIQITV